MKPLYIFDLDGTLALIDHRRPILDEKDDPNRWRRFYAACAKDEPNEPVVQTMEALRMFADVWIFSGRSDEVRAETVEWLRQYTSLTAHDLETCLVMRQAGDHRPDDELKQEWLRGMLIDDRLRLRAAFDDRDRVVAMWRANNVSCFQVAPGNF